MWMCEVREKKSKSKNFIPVYVSVSWAATRTELYCDSILKIFPVCSNTFDVMKWHFRQAKRQVIPHSRIARENLFRITRDKRRRGGKRSWRVGGRTERRDVWCEGFRGFSACTTTNTTIIITIIIYKFTHTFFTHNSSLTLEIFRYVGSCEQIYY